MRHHNENAPPADQLWGARDFSVSDLDGNLIALYEIIWRPTSSARPEEAVSPCGEDIRIQMRTRCAPQLVHPEVWLGGQVAVPSYARPIQEVDVPGISRNRQDLLIHSHRRTRAIPVVHRTRIVDDLGGSRNVSLTSILLGHPHHKSAQLRACLPGEQRLLDSERPSETFASRRGHQKDHPHHARVGVEGVAQFLRLSAKNRV